MKRKQFRISDGVLAYLGITRVLVHLAERDGGWRRYLDRRLRSLTT